MTLPIQGQGGRKEAPVRTGAITAVVPSIRTDGEKSGAELLGEYLNGNRTQREAADIELGRRTVLIEHVLYWLTGKARGGPATEEIQVDGIEFRSRMFGQEPRNFRTNALRWLYVLEDSSGNEVGVIDYKYTHRPNGESASETDYTLWMEDPNTGGYVGAKLSDAVNNQGNKHDMLTLTAYAKTIPSDIPLPITPLGSFSASNGLSMEIKGDVNAVGSALDAATTTIGDIYERLHTGKLSVRPPRPTPSASE